MNEDDKFDADYDYDQPDDTATVKTSDSEDEVVVEVFMEDTGSSDGSRRKFPRSSSESKCSNATITKTFL